MAKMPFIHPSDTSQNSPSAGRFNGAVRKKASYKKGLLRSSEEHDPWWHRFHKFSISHWECARGYHPADIGSHALSRRTPLGGSR